MFNDKRYGRLAWRRAGSNQCKKLADWAGRFIVTLIRRSVLMLVRIGGRNIGCCRTVMKQVKRRQTELHEQRGKHQGEKDGRSAPVHDRTGVSQMQMTCKSDCAASP